MKRCLLVALALLALLAHLQMTAQAASANKPAKACRYRKGQWSTCDATSKMRSRTLTLKAGDKATCEPTRTLTKECSKACRYEKGAWGACDAQGQMTRLDRLKSTSDPSCAATRQITKRCAKDSNGGAQRGRKAQGGRRNKKTRATSGAV